MSGAVVDPVELTQILSEITAGKEDYQRTLRYGYL